MTEFFAHGDNEFTHGNVRYDTKQEASRLPEIVNLRNVRFWEPFNTPNTQLVVRELGHYNPWQHRVGTWKHYDTAGRLYKQEEYLFPWQDPNDTNSDGQRSTMNTQGTKP